MQWPVVEIEKLRMNPVYWPAKKVKGGELLQVAGVNAVQVRVVILIDCLNLLVHIAKC